MAQPSPNDESSDSMASVLQLRGQKTKHLIFELASEQYGIPLSSVKEVIAMVEITSVPHVAPFFKGLINLRGRIISVVDLRIKLGLTAGEYENEKTSIVITDVNDLTIGNIVDDVSEVLGLDESDIERDLDISSTVRREYILGVAKPQDSPLILMLDVKQLLSASELEMMKTEVQSAGGDDSNEATED